MNKKIIILIFLLATNLIICQKSGVAEYTKVSTHSYKKSNKADFDSETAIEYASADKNMKKLKFELKFNSQFAVFQEIKKFNSEADSNFQVNLARIMSGYFGPYYYDYKNQLTSRKRFNYLIQQQYKDYNWVLTKEKLIINNLNCFKAFTTKVSYGRSGIIEKPVVAWYTTDISIPAGPDGFAGLPGLIVQLE